MGVTLQCLSTDPSTQGLHSYVCRCLEMWPASCGESRDKEVLRTSLASMVSSGWFSETPCLKAVRHRTIEEGTSVLPWPKNMYMQVHAATHSHIRNAGAGEERNPLVYYRVEFYVFAYNSFCFLSTFYFCR